DDAGLPVRRPRRRGRRAPFRRHRADRRGRRSGLGPGSEDEPGLGVQGVERHPRASPALRCALRCPRARPRRPPARRARARGSRCAAEWDTRAEIASTQAAAGLERSLFEAMAQVYTRIAETQLARGNPEDLPEELSLDDVL